MVRTCLAGYWKKSETSSSEMKIRTYTEKDLPEMVRVWNEVIEAGIYFDYNEILDVDYVRKWFAEQTATVVAEDDNGHICGMYILHPNGRGRCSHIANASYAVEECSRGQGIGELLVTDSIERARQAGFRILQFNCVVEGNMSARHLYEKLGFTQIGTIHGGLQIKDGTYVNTCPYYIEL